MCTILCVHYTLLGIFTYSNIHCISYEHVITMLIYIFLAIIAFAVLS